MKAITHNVTIREVDNGFVVEVERSITGRVAASAEMLKGPWRETFVTTNSNDLADLVARLYLVGRLKTGV